MVGTATTKSLKDGSGNAFNGRFLDDGSGVVTPGSYSPGGLFTSVASFARPANSNTYSANARVADSTTAATVLEFANVMRAAGEAARIERLRIRSDRTGSTPVAALIGVQFRVHLFRTQPTATVNDAGIFTTANILALADIAGYVGTIDVTFDKGAVIGVRGVGIPSTGSGITVEAPGTTGHETSMWAIVETLGSFAGVSGETFTLTLEASRS